MNDEFLLAPLASRRTNKPGLKITNKLVFRDVRVSDEDYSKWRVRRHENFEVLFSWLIYLYTIHLTRSGLLTH